MAGFIDPDELANSFGAKTPSAGAKTPAVANARVASADQKARDADAAQILRNELVKTIRKLGAIESTPVPAKKEDADARTASIQRAEADLASIRRELKRVGAEVASPQDSAAPPSAPASAAPPSAPASAPASAAASDVPAPPGFIDPDQLKDSFVAKPDTSSRFDISPNNIRTMGSPSFVPSNLLAEMGSNAPIGSVAELKSRLNPQSGAADVARAMAEKKAPAIEYPVMPVEPEPLQSSGAKWLGNWADHPDAANFEGGVPEGAQKFNRGKPRGKVTSEIYKKFGPMKPGSLNVGRYDAAAAEAAAKAAHDAAVAEHTAKMEAYEKAVKQAKIDTAAREAKVSQESAATSNAARLSGPLSWLNKTLHYGGAGLGGYDALRRLGVFDKGETSDPTGAAISGAGALAQLASPYVPAVAGAVAGPLTAAALPVAATVAPLINMARDRKAYLMQHPEAFQLVTDDYDIMGNRVR
jgi:hypothetical protein